MFLLKDVYVFESNQNIQSFVNSNILLFDFLDSSTILIIRTNQIEILKVLFKLINLV